ncbi:MAG: nucleotidyltransferase, partial [Oscillospiraceae bacterium]
YGVTYKEDKQMVVNALKALRDSGKYPQNLWNGK